VENDIPFQVLHGYAINSNVFQNVGSLQAQAIILGGGD
jgi:hypothetical protein